MQVAILKVRRDCVTKTKCLCLSYLQRASIDDDTRWLLLAWYFIVAVSFFAHIIPCMHSKEVRLSI